MSATILQFPECGHREGRERHDPIAGLVFDRARFARFIPLRDEDVHYILENANSYDPTTQHRARELLACAVALRHYKGHAQGEIAARIVRGVLAGAESSQGPRAA